MDLRVSRDEESRNQASDRRLFTNVIRTMIVVWSSEEGLKCEARNASGGGPVSPVSILLDLGALNGIATE
jgi:hypothetical protein